MKHPPILAALAVLVALVVALGIAFWPGPATEPTEQAPAAHQVQEPAVAPLPVTAGPGDRKQPNEREVVPVQLDAGADLPQGIRGVVVGPDGNPLPGLRVFLIENAAGNPFLLHQAMQAGVPMLPAAQTVTDARGSFALGVKKPSDKKYDVRVLADQHADGMLGPLQIKAGDWYDAGLIRLAQGAVVRGRVTIAGTDFPAPQAVVTLTSANAFEEMARASLPGREQGLRVLTDANGYYELRNAPLQGPWSLQAVAPGFARVARSPIDVNAEQVNTIDFELPRGLSIQGRILASSGRPVPDARVQATAMQTDGSRLEAFADQQGNFEVHGMREGSQWLRITAKGFRLHDERDVAAGTQGLQVILEETGSARARVRDQDGRILERYVLGVRRFFPHLGGQIGAVLNVPDVSVRAEDLVDGAMTLSGIEPGTDQERVQYVFQVQADGFAKTLSDPFELTATAPLIEVTLTRGAILIGQVLDERSQPIADAEVVTQGEGSLEDSPLRGFFSNLAPDKITRAKVRTDAEGRFRLERLGFAEYQLKVSHAEYCDGIVHNLELKTPNEQRLPAIVLQRGTLVRGTTAVDGAAQGQIKVVVDADPAAAEGGQQLRVETVSNHDGTFALPKRLPPGNYEIKAAQMAADTASPDIFRQILQMKKTAVTFELRAGQSTAEHSLNIVTTR